MKLRLAGLLLLLTLPLFAQQATPQEEEKPNYNFVDGPTVGDLGQMAQIAVPEGYVFTGAKDTQRIMEAFGNPVSGEELGFLAPQQGDWFIVFEFTDTGYIKDDEKDKLDADAILQSIREGTEASNIERRKRGWDTLEILGWAKAPFYNPVTNHLEWATRAQSGDGTLVINYNSRILGRAGVMGATLVVNPEELDAVLPSFQQTLAGYEYKSGHRYAEWRQGDKIAQYGLAGLILGGGAAVASKVGLLQKFWKILIIPVIAAFSFITKFFKRDRE